MRVPDRRMYRRFNVLRIWTVGPTSSAPVNLTASQQFLSHMSGPVRSAPLQRMRQ